MISLLVPFLYLHSQPWFLNIRMNFLLYLLVYFYDQMNLVIEVMVFCKLFGSVFMKFGATRSISLLLPWIACLILVSTIWSNCFPVFYTNPGAILFIEIIALFAVSRPMSANSFLLGNPPFCLLYLVFLFFNVFLFFFFFLSLCILQTLLVVCWF